MKFEPCLSGSGAPFALTLRLIIWYLELGGGGGGGAQYPRALPAQGLNFKPMFSPLRTSPETQSGGGVGLPPCRCKC